jgi:diadenosine tetraphosphate (Ap4A) HIT family hydrolase
VDADLYQNLMDLPDEFPGMDQVPAFAVYLMGCSKFEPFYLTLRSLMDPDKYCPFCETEHVRRARRTLQETPDWRLIENEFPNPKTQRMLLIVPRSHVTSLADLLLDDYMQIGVLLRFCHDVLGIKSGGILWRFGDPHLHAGTVEHLHINVIEPWCGTAFRPPFAKNVDEHAGDYERMLRFRDELVVEGGLDWLFPKSEEASH